MEFFLPLLAGDLELHFLGTLTQISSRGYKNGKKIESKSIFQGKTSQMGCGWLDFVEFLLYHSKILTWNLGVFSLPQILRNSKVFIMWNMQWDIANNRVLVSNDFLLNLSQKSKLSKWLILPFFKFLSLSVEKFWIFFHFSALYRSIIWCWHLLPDTIPLRCLSAHVQQFGAYSSYLLILK